MRKICNLSRMRDYQMKKRTKNRIYSSNLQKNNRQSTNINCSN